MNKNYKISIASDHAGFELKEFLKSELASKNYEVFDLGTDSKNSVDYPDFAEKLALHIKDKKSDFGILICGSGIGISIAANRYNHIRAALCNNLEVTKLARQHNNANVICLGARFIDNKIALEMVEAFFNTEFEGGRHTERVRKLCNAK
ncbi:MAG: ribose 5-phosphate isomerase B [Rickettsiales bacterium]|nr:ribose 5-phosphate isomerase B [Rickettsiales bacterium]